MTIRASGQRWISPVETNCSQGWTAGLKKAHTYLPNAESVSLHPSLSHWELPLSIIIWNKEVTIQERIVFFFNITPAQEGRSNGSSPGEQQSNRPVREFSFTKDELGFSGLHGRHGKQQEWGTKLCVWFISHFKIENTKVYFKNTSNQNQNSFSSNSLLIYVFSICLHLTFCPSPPKNKTPSKLKAVITKFVEGNTENC